MAEWRAFIPHLHFIQMIDSLCSIKSLLTLSDYIDQCFSTSATLTCVDIVDGEFWELKCTYFTVYLLRLKDTNVDFSGISVTS